PEARATAATPGASGTSLTVAPAVFAAGISGELGVSVVDAPAGVYADATVETAPAAGVLAMGAAAPAAASTFRVATSAPRRISARVDFAVEDLAAVGTDTYERSLRESLVGALSDAADSALVADLLGQLDGNYFEGRTQDRVSFRPFGYAMSQLLEHLCASAIDGTWARRLGELALFFGVEHFTLAGRGFVAAGGDTRAREYYPVVTSSRWPADGSFLLVRHGRPVRPAVAPLWPGLAIDDTITAAPTGEYRLSLHALLGAAIVRHRRAYIRGMFSDDGIDSGDDRAFPVPRF
ncbi:MAG: hypothetical protein OXI15_03490, partial [Chromatiales bacterium]|nr:hypothetical protein [Chromatiales bacterium]